MDIYRKIVEKIGLENMVEVIPFTKAEISTALSCGDEHLNTLKISEWDKAAGYVWKNGRLVSRFSSRLDRLTANVGLSLTCSQSVCLLKQAAKIWAEEITEEVAA